MKKFIALMLVLVMALAMAACTGNTNTTGSTTTAPTTTAPTTTGSNEGPKDDPAVKSEGVMTYEEYMAAEIGTVVTIEAYVQANQNWWNNKITLYTQDLEGAYFLYEVPCTEEEAAKLVKGTKVRVTGEKKEWSGEIEIMNITKFEILEGSYIAEVLDVTELAADETKLAEKMNMFATIKGATVAASKDAEGNDVAFLYNWDGSGSAESDSDLYFNITVGEKTYTFCVEYYLCGPDSDAYKAVQNLKVGDKIDLEGFLYWYEGCQMHTTSVTVVAE